MKRHQFGIYPAFSNHVITLFINPHFLIPSLFLLPSLLTLHLGIYVYLFIHSFNHSGSYP